MGLLATANHLRPNLANPLPRLVKRQHADILSDLAAALAGSIGIAPTSNLDPTRRCPSMFEPIHGSAPDIVGKGVANPVATFWTAAEMLTWLGEKDAAAQLMECVETVCENRVVTPDLGGRASTRQVTAAVVAAIKAHADRSAKVANESALILDGYGSLC